MSKVVELEGTRLAVARKRRGMSHAKLGELTGISAKTLKAWEEKTAWCNSLDAISKLATALGYPQGFFVGPEIELLQDWQVSF